jgi:hypothetical protein
VRDRSGRAIQTDIVTDAFRMPEREWRGFVMSNLPRDQRHPMPLTPADLQALGVPAEVLRGLAVLAPFSPAPRQHPVVQLSAYHVRKKEILDGTAEAR